MSRAVASRLRRLPIRCGRAGRSLHRLFHWKKLPARALPRWAGCKPICRKAPSRIRLCSRARALKICRVVGELDAGDVQKIEFINCAMKDGFHIAPSRGIEEDVRCAIEWEASRDSVEVMRLRDNMLSRLEAWGQALRRDGAVEQWFAGADDATRAVSADVNGPLLAALLDMTSYDDTAAADLFRYGAPLLGKLPHAGSGPAEKFPEPTSSEELLTSSPEHNRSILSSLREDANSSAIHEGALADASLSRMTAPVVLAKADLGRVRLSPRFSIVQGVKPDGAPKVRVVDDESRGGINSACQPAERLLLDGADVLVDALRCYHGLRGHAPALFKADIDSAYRRVPIAPEHRLGISGCPPVKASSWGLVSGFQRNPAFAVSLSALPQVGSLQHVYARRGHLGHWSPGVDVRRPGCRLWVGPSRCCLGAPRPQALKDSHPPIRGRFLRAVRTRN